MPPTNVPPSSDDEEDFDNPIDCETSQVVDFQGSMMMFSPMTSSYTGFGSDIDNCAGKLFRNGIPTADCGSDCKTPRVLGQSRDVGNGIGTRPRRLEYKFSPFQQTTVPINIISNDIVINIGCSNASTDCLSSVTVPHALCEDADSKKNCCPYLVNRTISAATFGNIDDKYLPSSSYRETSGSP